MQVRDVWRTTTFRLSAFYGLLFAFGTAALLAVVYLQADHYLDRRVDAILNTEAAALASAPPRVLPRRIADGVALNGGQTNIFALFSADRRWLAGNLRVWPPSLVPQGLPVETPPTAVFPAYARLRARTLPSGDILVVGRDVKLMREMRAIMASALSWSGALIVLMGLAFGIALSLRPLQRLRLIRSAAEEIARGDLQRRIPVSTRRDELDMVAVTVNAMIGEVERLMGEVKATTDTIAHDLRTPLTRARAQLHRMQQFDSQEPGGVARVVAEIDEVLERFRAILRISEIEARKRHAAFTEVAPADLVTKVVELYAPLAEAGGVALTVEADFAGAVDADEKLMFEAVSNLVDNALKFSDCGGAVRVGARLSVGGPRIVVEDDGPGVDPDERKSILRRFYRSERARMTPGSGLGLSIVAAIVRQHDFRLHLEDAEPGLRVIIDCWSAPPIPDRKAER